MTTRPPSGPESDQPHIKLGALVRGVLSGRGTWAPVPLIPAPLRKGLPRRRRAGRAAWLAVGAVAMALVALGVAGAQRLRAVSYVVERPRGAGGSTRVRFSDGTVALADASTRLAVVSTGRTFAQLRLDDGRARLHVAGGPHIRFAVLAGPYSAAVASAGD